jgi:hypothetical protein
MILFLILILLLALPRISHAGGGGSSTTQVDQVGPKNERLIGLENQFYDLADMTMGAYTNKLVSNGNVGGLIPAALARLTFNPDGSVSQSAVSNGKNGTTSATTGKTIPQPYDNNTLMGQLFNDATKKTYVANNRYDTLMQEAPQLSSQISGLLGQGVDAVNQSKTAGDWYFDQAKGDYGNAQNYLAQAGTAGDPWYAKAMGAYDSASGLLGQIQNNLSYTSEANKWYDDYTRGMLGRSQTLLDTGQIPQPIMDAMLSAMTTGVNQSVGSNINDLASRGVINSSVTNRGLADASRAVSDSMNSNYLNAFNTILSGTNQTAQTGADAGKTFADINLNVNNAYSDAMKNAIGLGDSYGKTGSMKVNDLLGVPKGTRTTRAH